MNENKWKDLPLLEDKGIFIDELWDIYIRDRIFDSMANTLIEYCKPNKKTLHNFHLYCEVEAVYVTSPYSDDKYYHPKFVKKAFQILTNEINY